MAEPTFTRTQVRKMLWKAYKAGDPYSGFAHQEDQQREELQKMFPKVFTRRAAKAKAKPTKRKGR